MRAVNAGCVALRRTVWLAEKGCGQHFRASPIHTVPLIRVKGQQRNICERETDITMRCHLWATVLVISHSGFIIDQSDFKMNSVFKRHFWEKQARLDFIRWKSIALWKGAGGWKGQMEKPKTFVMSVSSYLRGAASNILIKDYEGKLSALWFRDAENIGRNFRIQPLNGIYFITLNVMMFGKF